MKKGLTLVLLVVMLIVSFLPCADVQASSTTEKTKITESTTDRHDDHSQQDQCPPFCQCECCSLVSFYLPVQTDFTPVIQYHQPYLSQPANAVVQKPHDIWQPPQL
ncbi:MAG TPA: DUF6660 family protein [Flavisolibacter sp.]|nr:DUF6660 family protein [Flavisolibacter sp.]